LVQKVGPVRQADDADYGGGTHRIVIERDRLNDWRIARVSLFDHLTYEVVLSQEVLKIWYPLKGGCTFDLKQMTISDISP
jgi:hypothetical protein